MSLNATITRIVRRPNGCILHLDAYPHKLGIIRATHTPAVGERVSGDAGTAHIWHGQEGEGGMIACYRREGLRLYERSGDE